MSAKFLILKHCLILQMYRIIQENLSPTLRTKMVDVPYDYSKDLTEYESLNFGIGHYGQSVYSFEEEGGVFITPTIVDSVHLDGIKYASHKLLIPRQLGEKVAKSQIYCTKLHPCVIELKEGYTSVENNEYTLHMIYDYCKGTTIFSQTNNISHIVIQILSCMKAIHLKKLYFGGCLHPHKIFYSKENLIKIGGIGIGAILYDESVDVMQQNDIIQFGYMLLEVMTKSIPFIETVPELLDKIEQEWLKSIIYKCITKTFDDINELLLIVSPFMFQSINLLATKIDVQQKQINKYNENDRITHLLYKLGSINERCEYSNAANWSEIGGNYLLKLFRDFLFHQVDEKNKPVSDIYHLTYHLNKVIFH